MRPPRGLPKKSLVRRDYKGDSSLAGARELTDL